MRVINEPSVYIVGKSVVNTDGLNKFTGDRNIKNIGNVNEPRSNGEFLCETAGRLCYWSFDKPRPGGTHAYFDRIKEQAHGSVLEHSSFNFIFAGISRSLSHELVRHRAGWGFSQLSQRYVDESDCAFVRPVELVPGTTAHVQWVESTRAALVAYTTLVAEMLSRIEREHKAAFGDSVPLEKTETRKRARQTARAVLPNCTETVVFATANVRAIRHFLEQRGGMGAEPEIRRLAGHVLDMVRDDSPHLFADYQTNDLPDGTRHIYTKTPKV